MFLFMLHKTIAGNDETAEKIRTLIWTIQAESPKMSSFFIFTSSNQ